MSPTCLFRGSYSYIPSWFLARVSVLERSPNTRLSQAILSTIYQESWKRLSNELSVQFCPDEQSLFVLVRGEGSAIGGRKLLMLVWRKLEDHHRVAAPGNSFEEVSKFEYKDAREWSSDHLRKVCLDLET